MLSLPPASERSPVRRCFAVVDGRRCFGEVLTGPWGNVAFTDPEHPKLKAQPRVRVTYTTSANGSVFVQWF
jgi:hypothetical protein